jgi:hypothetical protein
MNARVKLNNASVHGALAFAGLIGWLAGSFELFLFIAAVLCATAYYGGDIRTTPRRK